MIVLDGYHGFTPIQLGLIGRLLTLTDELYVDDDTGSQGRAISDGGGASALLCYEKDDSGSEKSS